MAKCLQNDFTGCDHIDFYTLIRPLHLGIICHSVVCCLKSWRILCLHRKKPCWLCQRLHQLYKNTMRWAVEFVHYNRLWLLFIEQQLLSTKFGFFLYIYKCIYMYKSMMKAHSNKIWKSSFSNTFYYTKNQQKQLVFKKKATNHTKLKSKLLKQVVTKNKTQTTPWSGGRLLTF